MLNLNLEWTHLAWPGLLWSCGFTEGAQSERMHVAKPRGTGCSPVVASLVARWELVVSRVPGRQGWLIDV